MAKLTRRAKAIDPQGSASSRRSEVIPFPTDRTPLGEASALTDRALRMDGFDLLRRVPTGAAAAAFLDPQYRGVLDRLDYGNEGARQKGRASLAQMDEATIGRFVSELARTLRPSGHLFLWVDVFHLAEGVSPWLAGTGLSRVDLICWDKLRMGMGYRSRRRTEYLLVLQKAPQRAKGVWTIHDIPDCWAEKAPRGGAHPHAKPEGLQRRLIEATTSPGDLVLDPASGGFSVMRSAVATGRRFLGCDLVFGEEL
jgi:site-specific DNA-methyltransferase (adenine-specific)